MSKYSRFQAPMLKAAIRFIFRDIKVYKMWCIFQKIFKIWQKTGLKTSPPAAFNSPLHDHWNANRFFEVTAYFNSFEAICKWITSLTNRVKCENVKHSKLEESIAKRGLNMRTNIDWKKHHTFKNNSKS